MLVKHIALKRIATFLLGTFESSAVVSRVSAFVEEISSSRGRWVSPYIGDMDIRIN